MAACVSKTRPQGFLIQTGGNAQLLTEGGAGEMLQHPGGQARLPPGDRPGSPRAVARAWSARVGAARRRGRGFMTPSLKIGGR